MNEEIKKQWVADLRDGTRTQGQDCLRNKAGDQCCLDVLMEQGVRAGIVPEPVYDEVEGCWGYKREVYEYEKPADSDGEEGYKREFSLLTNDVVKWAGLESTDPAVNYPGDIEVTAGIRTLSACNDFLKLDFPAIASLIEEQL